MPFRKDEFEFNNTSKYIMSTIELPNGIAERVQKAFEHAVKLCRKDLPVKSDEPF
jgi:hypothetical protein